MSLRMGAENLEINQALHTTLQIPQEVLLEVLLEHSDFAHFRKYADDDYRDPNQKNAPLSLSTKGWYDHSGDEGGSLFELTEARHLTEEHELGVDRFIKKIDAVAVGILLSKLSGFGNPQSILTRISLQKTILRVSGRSQRKLIKIYLKIF